MIREYAVDPDASCQNLDALQRFFSDFRAENGRVITSIPASPKNWEREQQQKIRDLNLPPVARKKCFDRLKEMEKHSLIGGLQIADDLANWIDKARDVKSQMDVDSIITTNTDQEHCEYDYAQILFTHPANWTLGQTMSVARNADALANAISCSLSIAKIALFVDPYFHPIEDRYRRPLIKFISKLAGGRQPCHKAYLHTVVKEDKPRADIERGLREHVCPLLPVGFTLETWLWPPQLLHDRFILTKQVGYAFGHGLDEATYQGAIEVNVNRIAEIARDKEFKVFSNSAPRQGEPIVIVGE